MKKWEEEERIDFHTLQLSCDLDLTTRGPGGLVVLVDWIPITFVRLCPYVRAVSQVRGHVKQLGERRRLSFGSRPTIARQ